MRGVTFPPGFDYEPADFDRAYTALTREGFYADGDFARFVAAQAAAMVEGDRSLSQALTIIAADLTKAAARVKNYSSVRQDQLCDACSRNMSRGEPHAAECRSALAQDVEDSGRRAEVVG